MALTFLSSSFSSSVMATPERKQIVGAALRGSVDGSGDPLFAAEAHLLSRFTRSGGAGPRAAIRRRHDDGGDNPHAKVLDRRHRRMMPCVTTAMVLLAMLCLGALATDFLLRDEAAVMRAHAEFFPPRLVSRVLGKTSTLRVKELSTALVAEVHKESEQRKRIALLVEALKNEKTVVAPRVVKEEVAKQKAKDAAIVAQLEKKHANIRAKLKKRLGAQAAEKAKGLHRDAEKKLERKLSREHAKVLILAQEGATSKVETAKMQALVAQLREELVREQSAEAELKARLDAVNKHESEGSSEAALRDELANALEVLREKDARLLEAERDARASGSGDAAEQRLAEKVLGQITDKERNHMIAFLVKQPHAPSLARLQKLHNAELIVRHDHALKRRAVALESELKEQERTFRADKAEISRLKTALEAKPAPGGYAAKEKEWEVERSELMLLATALKNSKEKLALRLAQRQSPQRRLLRA